MHLHAQMRALPSIPVEAEGPYGQNRSRAPRWIALVREGAIWALDDRIERNSTSERGCRCCYGCSCQTGAEVLNRRRPVHSSPGWIGLHDGPEDAARTPHAGACNAPVQVGPDSAHQGDGKEHRLLLALYRVQMRFRSAEPPMLIYFSSRATVSVGRKSALEGPGRDMLQW